MVIVELQGGLGNQLFQYCAALVAAHGDSAAIMVDRKYYWYVRNRTYVLEQLGLQAKSLSLWGRVLACSMPTYMESKPYVFDAQLAKQHLPFILCGFWQHHRYVDQVYDQLQNKLVFPALCEPDAQIRDTILRCESVAVHVRRGDYLRSNAFAVCSPAYTHDAFFYIQAHIKTPHFFFFSDDIDWCQQEFGRHDTITYVKTAREMSDLALMSLCQHHVIANSTFSWWGARLKKSQGITIAPQDWCGNRAAAHALILPSWVTIKAS